MWTDALGNPVTLDGAGAALPAVNDFVEGFIACESRVLKILPAADTDHSPLVQAYAAAVHMFAEAAGAADNARPFLARAQARAQAATPREQRFIAAIAAWVEGDMPRAVALHEEQAREYPRDLASLKLGQYHQFNLGNSPAVLRMGLAALPAAGDVPYLHGMLAFAWEQCHFLEEAEAAARQAIQMRRKEPWAHHALAHVMLTQGRVREGYDFMRGVSETWTGLNSFMETHNWWHHALFALELERHDEVLALYDRHVWGVAPDYTQDQVNAVSLLARLELAGVDVGTRWQALAPHLLRRLHDHVLPFLDLHYLYGLARAGRAEAQQLLRNIEAYADTGAPEHARATWRQVCVPAARGVLAHAQGEMAHAAPQLTRALPRLLEIGGSHAQRDLFGQMHLDALTRSGRLADAQDILQRQLHGQPESLRLKRQAQALYASLGLEALAP